MDKDGNEMITLTEAANYAGVPLRTVRHAAQKGYLRTHQFGKVRLTTRPDVDAWTQSDKKRRGRTP